MRSYIHVYAHTLETHTSILHMFKELQTNTDISCGVYVQILSQTHSHIEIFVYLSTGME